MSIRTDLVLEESEKRADINGVLIKNFNNIHHHRIHLNLGCQKGQIRSFHILMHQ